MISESAMATSELTEFTMTSNDRVSGSSRWQLVPVNGEIMKAMAIAIGNGDMSFVDGIIARWPEKVAEGELTLILSSLRFLLSQ